MCYEVEVIGQDPNICTKGDGALTRPTRTKITTRPTVAAALTEAGITVTRKPNIFNPKLSAWEYPDTQETRRIVWEITQGAGRDEA